MGRGGTSRIIVASTGILAALAFALAPGVGASSTYPSEVSGNWAGYVVTALAGSSATYKKVSAAWTQPQAQCSGGTTGYASFWVGIGGFNQGSSALEQLGTDSDCKSGSPVYYAWWEIVPAAAVKFSLTIHPGDKVNASVSISGQTVTMTLNDQTSNKSATKTQNANVLDESPAEWIAEAPSVCNAAGCTVLPLASYPSVLFAHGSTSTKNGYQGNITDSHWQTTQLTMAKGGRVLGVRIRSALTPQPQVAVPTAVNQGVSFTVTPQQTPSVPGPYQPPK
jgi:Peptidase A4 family